MCGCQLWNGRSSSLQFSLEHVLDVCSQCATLSHNELDMVLLGQLMATSNTNDSIVTESRHAVNKKEDIHQLLPSEFVVCPYMFRFLHGVGGTRVKNLSKSLRSNGLQPRINGNTKRLPKCTLSNLLFGSSLTTPSRTVSSFLDEYQRIAEVTSNCYHQVCQREGSGGCMTRPLSKQPHPISVQQHTPPFAVSGRCCPWLSS